MYIVPVVVADTCGPPGTPPAPLAIAIIPGKPPGMPGKANWNGIAPDCCGGTAVLGVVVVRVAPPAAF